MNQSSPESHAYNVAFTVRILSPLDTAALKVAFQKILNRHPSLRTNFKLINENPVQEVHGYKEIFFKLIDVKHNEIRDLKEKIRKTNEVPFALDEDDLFRVYLFRISETDCILLMSFHHIVTDGKSIGIVFDELWEIYRQETGNHASLPHVETRYSDFVQWQSEFLKTDQSDSELNYWKDELKGDLPVLNIFSEKPRPPIQTFNGGTVYFSIENEIAEKLKEMSKLEAATFFSVLLSSYFILLHKYSQQDEIICGIPTAGRPEQRFENVAGYFINPVSIRSDISDDPDFSTYLKRIQKKILSAISNQNIPFASVIEKLFHKRDASRTTVFQTFLGLQKIQPAALQELFVPGNEGARINYKGIDFEEFDIEQQSGQFDITAEFSEGKKFLSGALKYNTDLFDREFVEQMSKHFKNLIGDIAHNRGRKISELRLLSDEEENSILVERNDTTFSYDEFDCVHKLIEKQAAETPGRVSLVYENETMTYEEMNKRANRLANYLKNSGIGKESLVCLFMERSFNMVISMLGVLKSGAAYIPVDVSYPSDRIEFMIKDSSASVIITQGSLKSRLPATGSKILVIEDEENELSKLNSGNLNLNVPVDDLAYVIYTSGSTGVPKGVMIEHKSLSNHMLWMKDAFGFKNSDSVLQKTPFSFDASVWEFYLPLMTGGKLIITKPEGHLDAGYLIETILKNDVSVIQFVPTMLRLLIDEDGIENCTSLRYVFSGGEQLTVDLTKKVFAKLNADLVNLYGPTEVTIDSLFYKCENSGEQTIPIGRPVYNTRAYVLDKYLNPVPDGVAGELFLGGLDVARGYLNNPELTNDRFIPDKFSGENKKMYKTGDAVRWNRDGNVEYIGRIDQQVKFRGFRIELGEIEAKLLECDGVKEAVADIRTDRTGVKKLIAYVVADPSAQNSEDSLKAYLMRKLPEYMVPSSIKQIEKIPVTPGGKTDKSSLPDIDASTVHENFVKPKNETERILAEVWKEVLNLKQVSVNDNFFELGGDSILSIQIISKAKQHGIRITPRQMFQFQTISGVSSEAEVHKNANAEQGIVTGEAELIPIQRWFFEKKKEMFRHYNHSVLMSVPKNIDQKLLKKALEVVINHHDALRSQFKPAGNGWIQVFSGQKNSIPFTEVQIKGKGLAEFKDNLNREIKKLQDSIDPVSGDVISVALLKSPEEKNDRLLIIVHHLVIDGVSWRILLEDLYDVYTQLETKGKFKLNEKTSSFKEWSEALKEYAVRNIAEERKYWEVVSKTKNINRPEITANGNLAGNEKTIYDSLTEEETSQILHTVPKAYNTQINDILLTALAFALNKCTGECESLISLETHGREDISESIDLSRTIGWFTAMYPFVLKLDDKNDIGRSIKFIKEDLRRVPRNGIGYGLMKYLLPDSNLDYVEPQIVFNYLGQINDRIKTDSDWKLSKSPILLSQSPDSERSSLIEINGMIVGQKLKFEFNYNPDFHDDDYMKNFANEFVTSLREINGHCLSKEEKAFTPSDFSASGLNQQDLDSLIENLN